MSNIYYYRIWCNTENTWTYTWNTITPTVCPNNNTHTIDTDKISTIDSILETQLTDLSVKPWVHQTSRKLGLKTHFTGKGDDPTNVLDIGNGQVAELQHISGQDDINQVLYIDFNCVTELNETWVHEGYIIWKGALFDRVSMDVVPRVTSYIKGIGWDTSQGITQNFLGEGLDDCTASGTFSGSSTKHFTIEIDTTGVIDTFKWSNDGGETWENTEVSITGSGQTLEEGVTVTFENITGHTLEDKWEFYAVASDQYYNLYGGYLIIPASGNGNVKLMADLTDPQAGLVYLPDSELGTPPVAFWNADFDTETNKYKNISAAPYGNGRFNIFGTEITLIRFVNNIPFLGDGFEKLQSSDSDLLGHGMRFKFYMHTIGEDHTWRAASIITLHRARTI